MAIQTDSVKSFGFSMYSGNGIIQNGSYNYFITAPLKLSGSNLQMGARVYHIVDGDSNHWLAISTSGSSISSCSNFSSYNFQIANNEMSYYKDTLWKDYVEDSVWDDFPSGLPASVLFPLTSINTVEYATNQQPAFSVNARKPKLVSSFTFSNYCSSIYSGSYSLFIDNSYTYELQDSSSGSGGSGGTINLNSDDIVNAILIIPATMIVLSVFLVIYRMFINRRVRG